MYKVGWWSAKFISHLLWVSRNWLKDLKGQVTLCRRSHDLAFRTLRWQTTIPLWKLMTVVKLISSFFQLCEATVRIKTPVRSTPAGGMDFMENEGKYFSVNQLSHSCPQKKGWKQQKNVTFPPILAFNWDLSLLFKMKYGIINFLSDNSQTTMII